MSNHMTQETTKSLLPKMEIAIPEEEVDLPLQIDSGTESFNESPIIEDSTTMTSQNVWDMAIEKESVPKPKSIKSILDKSISIEEENLLCPLEPTVVNPCINNGTPDKKELISILRKTSCYGSVDNNENQCCKATPRRVSFPLVMDILANYKEPELIFPFKLDEPLESEEILEYYQKSCKKNQTIELDTIKNQINDIKNNMDHSASLNLSNLHITMEVCETLEDLFKKTNFQSISFKECTFNAESVREFINILEYYNASTEYITTEHFVKADYEAWCLFCNMCSRSQLLQLLSFEDFNFTDQQINKFLDILTVNTSIRTLKFNNCKLGNKTTTLLVNTLMRNTSVQELYLPQTGLFTKEADMLGKLLSHNHFLKVLDISNNLIGDRGLEVLAKGLCTQTSEGLGLSVLVMFNCQITEKSGPIISNIIAQCKSLSTLNIGYNPLTDEFIEKIYESLASSQSLQGLGLQSTILTDLGVGLLAQCIQKNASLKKINLRGNKAVQTEGLQKLCQALTNTKITKLEIDETNRNCDDPESFAALVKQINAICTVNKSRDETSEDDEIIWSMYFSRKISLNCEPIYSYASDCSNIMKSASPGSSATSPVSRFSVSRVPDTLPRSRFTVLPVKLPAEFGSGDTLSTSPPPDEELCVSQFSNIRSSVSSIESVDSISNRDSVYDSTTPSGESD